jgi:hypothetical protein
VVSGFPACRGVFSWLSSQRSRRHCCCILQQPRLGAGHEAICELAFLELDDTARQRVIALIRQDEEFPTFCALCNWADRPRQRAPEHFVNLPRNATGIDRDECPLAYECVVSAIKEDFTVLASSETTDQEKLAALKFLGHWVGDIHQPLHAGFQDDRGGNHIRTRASTCESLHTLWDSCIVEERRSAPLPGRG